MITTKSNKAKREISIPKPNILKMKKMNDIISLIGEETAVRKVQNQIIIDFRANIRSLLEHGDIKNKNFTHSDEDIKTIGFKNWIPETRVRKSPEERAAQVIKGLNQEQLEAVLRLAGKI